MSALDHTRLKATCLQWVKERNGDKSHCGVTENGDHIILHCNMYDMERQRSYDKLQEVEPEWNLMGILGTEGQREERS